MSNEHNFSVFYEEPLEIGLSTFFFSIWNTYDFCSGGPENLEMSKRFEINNHFVLFFKFVWTLLNNLHKLIAFFGFFI